MEMLLGFAAFWVVLLLIVRSIKDSVNRRKYKKYTEKMEQDFEKIPISRHESKLNGYINYLRAVEEDSSSSRIWGKNYPKRTSSGMLGRIDDISEMQRILIEDASKNPRISESEKTEFKRSISDKLKLYLMREAEQIRKEEAEKTRLNEEINLYRKAELSRESRLQELLKIRLDIEYSSIWNSAGGEVSVEDALRSELPTQRFFVYKIAVGGDEYIGHTSLKPHVAMDGHISDARNGGVTELSKTLRRFGYVHEFNVVSEHNNEVTALLAKVIQIKMIKPILNLTFGGEGYRFNLVERKNELGEQVIFVQNNIVARVLTRWHSIQGESYYLRLKNRIEKRYVKLQQKLPKEKVKHIEEIYNITPPLDVSLNLLRLNPRLANFGNSKPKITYHELVEYINKKIELHRHLIKWSPVTQASFELKVKLEDFLMHNEFKLLKNAGRPLKERDWRDRSKMVDAAFTDNEFNPTNFIGIERLFRENSGAKLLSEKLFDNADEARAWLKRQQWFSKAISEGVLKSNDGLWPFRIKIGTYQTGFLNLQTEDNVTYLHVTVGDCISS